MQLELPEPDLPERVRLVVLFGGRSAEHEISCISAAHVLAAVDPGRYEVEAVGVTRDGGFVRAQRGDEMTATGPSVDLLALLEEGSIPTVAFPVLHGPNGEDGTIQGFFEIAGVPYVGSGVLASSVAMDKAIAKELLSATGIGQTPWRTFRSADRPDAGRVGNLLDELGPVVFVKPANMGSSVGVSRVEGSTDDLEAAIDEAFAYDDVVVVESGVDGRELECAVLGNDEPQASVLGEVLTDAVFYDYSDKYFDGTASTEIPAAMDPETMERGRELALRTYRAFRCSGMARVDLFLCDDGTFLVNEVNTIPGFTPISMYPKLWEASGIPYDRLIDRLVELALESHDRRASRAVSPS